MGGPARPEGDRPSHPRRRPDGLYPASGEDRRANRQRRVRQGRERQGSVQGSHEELGPDDHADHRSRAGMIASAFGVLFDGFAYGMLLFLLSVGLSVTLGMMNFVNLAHCSFAMLGGFVTVSLTNDLGWPFLASLPLAFLSAALVSIALERVLYRRLYGASDLAQCLLTIGIVFVSVACSRLLLRSAAGLRVSAARSLSRS